MDKRFDYIIAGLSLRSDIDLVAIGLRGFQPFEHEVCGEPTCTFHIRRDMTIDDFGPLKNISKSYLAESDCHSELAKCEGGYVYIVEARNESEERKIFHIDTATNRIESNIEWRSNYELSLLRFGIWVMFGIAIAPHSAIAIHSSVIESEERGVLFLGESGTGKSTHTRLWRENIKDAHLLNDDSPIIRIIDGEPRVFGSPWSGKTPCYRDLSYPIAGFCRLSQAPHNAIRRLNVIAALGAILPSCPPQFGHDTYLQDCICNTLDQILRKVGVYHLECLPDSAAAHLSHSTIIKGDA